MRVRVIASMTCSRLYPEQPFTDDNTTIDNFYLTFFLDNLSIIYYAEFRENIYNSDFTSIII